MEGHTKLTGRIVVIGGGACGIVTLKELRIAGLDAVLFEESSALGGVWVFDETRRVPWARAYKSLTTNSSRICSSFSDFPVPDCTPFPSGATLQRYYGDYVLHHGLEKYIFMETRVVDVHKTESGAWQVTTRNVQGEEKKQLFAGVVCATGTFGEPNSISLPGFTGGSITHSAWYRTPEDLPAGADVCLIGIGNSALDIGLDLALSNRFASVTICSNGAFILDCWDPIRNQPTDYVLLSREFYESSEFEKASLMNQLMVTDFFVEHGMPQPSTERVRTSFLKRRGLFMEAVREGKLRLRHAVKSANGNVLTLSDGSHLQASLVMACTGYRIRYPYMRGESLVESISSSVHHASYAQDYVRLYKQVLHPSDTTLAVVGCYDTIANTAIVGQMQARWIAAVWSGRITLPPLQARLKWVNERHAKDAARSTATPMYRAFLWMMNLYINDLGVSIPEDWPKQLPVLSALFVPSNHNKLMMFRSRL